MGRRSRRRRRGVGRTVAIAMLCVLLIVSISAVGFVGYLVVGDMLRDGAVVEVLAGGDWAEAEELEEVPAWLGELAEFPEEAPEYVPVEYEEAGVEPEQRIYAAYPFYIEENAEAYLEFHARYPGLSAYEVVWKVNAFLHLPFYSYIRVNNDSNPLLVNPSHRLPYGFVPAVLVPVYDGNPDLLATPETVEAFRRMRSSAINAGLDLAVASAYRTAERQRVLFDRQSGDGVVARPYQSEHQTGRALDLWGPGGLLDGGGGPPSATGLWVAANAHNYGFIVRYTAENTHITGFIHEPWHITYVSLGISRYIHRNNLSSLEEFVARNPGVGIGDL